MTSTPEAPTALPPRGGTAGGPAEPDPRQLLDGFTRIAAGVDGFDRWHSTTLVGVPASVLAGTGFNAQPQPLRIAGTREFHPDLFAGLERCAAAIDARRVFGDYMKGAFALEGATEARRWRASYLKLLQGWGMDSNSAAGAVLKGWVESRFGIVPVFHKEALARFPSRAWLAYLMEKSARRWHNNQILQQLDLLYDFSQWMLARYRPLGDGEHVTLWRGSTRCEEQVIAGSLRQRDCTLRLNNLVSFSGTREQAGCFGDWVLEAKVPMVKLLLWPGLLETSSLHGEAEVLVLGGDYAVRARYD